MLCLPGQLHNFDVEIQKHLGYLATLVVVLSVQRLFMFLEQLLDFILRHEVISDPGYL